MATPASLLAAMASVITTQTSATRLTSDYRVDLQRLTAGTTYYQLRGGPAGTDSVDSNVTRTVMSCEISLHHRLAALDGERAYTEVGMQTEVDGLVDPATWHAMAEVYDVPELPTYEVERVVNVVSTTITLQLVVTPEPVA